MVSPEGLLFFTAKVTIGYSRIFYNCLAPEVGLEPATKRSWIPNPAKYPVTRFSALRTPLVAFLNHLV